MDLLSGRRLSDAPSCAARLAMTISKGLQVGAFFEGTGLTKMAPVFLVAGMPRNSHLPEEPEVD